MIFAVYTTLLYGSCNIYYSVRVDYISNFHRQYSIFKFCTNVAWSLCIERMSLSTLRPLKHPRSISVVKAELDP